MQRHLQPDDRQAWDHFAHHLRLVVTHYYSTLFHAASDAFASLGADPHAERRLYRALGPLLAEAGYRPLPAALAAASVNGASPASWVSFGSDELRGFVAKANLYGTRPAPPFAPHVLVYTRGAAVEETTGYFLAAKLQLLWDTVLTSGPAGLLALASATEAPFTPPSTPQQAVLRRQTLHSRLVELGWGRWLAGRLTLREPALEAVVVVCPTAGNSPAVHLEGYQNVPVAHLFSVFPSETANAPAAAARPTRPAAHGALALLCCAVALATLPCPSAVLLLCLGLAHGVGVMDRLLHSSAHRGAEAAAWRRQYSTGSGAHLLAGMAADASGEATKRLLLGYFALWQHGPHSGEALGRAMALFLKDELDVDAEPPGAAVAQQLARLGLADGPRDGAAGPYRVSGSPQQILPQFDGLQVLHDVRLH
eukprot:EG_transcript_12297